MALENEYGLHIVGGLLGNEYGPAIVDFAKRAGAEEFLAVRPSNYVPAWRLAIEWLNDNRRHDTSHRWGIRGDNFGLWAGLEVGE